MFNKFLTALAGLLWLAGAFACFAQTSSVTVTGKITDAETGEPLPGAVVHLHETGASAVTNTAGNFSMDNVRPGTYHLHVHFLGFEELKKTIDVTKNTSFDFALKPAAIEMHEIVIEGEYLKADKRELTLPVEIVGEEYLEERLSISLAQTLEKIPGLATMNTGVGISKPVVRGFTGPRVLVNEYGIQQQGQDWGTDHGLEMDPFSSERVEVIKGPATIMYGSGAIGGVINILPHAVPATNSLQGEMAGLYRSVNNTFGTYGSFKGNYRNNYFILKGSIQDYGDYRVPAENFTYNGYVLPIYNRQLKNTAGKENAASATAGMMRNWGNARITVSNYHQEAGLFPGAVGTPRYYQLLSDGNERNVELPRQVNNHLKVIGHVQVMLNKNWLEVDAGYQQNDRREESFPHGHGQGNSISDSVALNLQLQTFTLRPKYHFATDSLTKIVAGLDAHYKTNTAGGFEFLIPDYKELSTAGFLLVTREISDRWNATVGLRSGFNFMDIAGHTIYYYDTSGNLINEDERAVAANHQYFNYSAALGATWLWNEHTTMRFNASRSYRNPNIAELAENGIHHGTFRHEKGDPEIKPEQGWQFDAGLEIEKKHFSGRLTSFMNYFDNYIYLSPTARFSPLPAAGQLYQFKQAEALHAGFEAFADYHPVKQFHLSNTIEYVYTFNLQSNLPLPFIPPLNITTSAAYEWQAKSGFIKSFKTGAEYEYITAQNQVDRNEMPTPGYQLINVFISGKLTVNKQQVHLNIRADNIVNSKYINHLSRYRLLNLPEPGRNVNLLIKIPLNNLLHEHE